MIKDIRSTSKSGIVLARGPGYDRALVCTAGMLFLKSFLSHIGAVRGTYPTTVQLEDGTDCVINHLLYVKLENELRKEVLDVRGRNRIRLKYGPYVIRLDLQGSESLFQTEQGFTTVDGSPSEKYDAAPQMSIVSSRNIAGFMSDDEMRDALKAAEPFFRMKLLTKYPDSENMLFLRFSEKEFLQYPNRLLRINYIDTRNA